MQAFAREAMAAEAEGTNTRFNFEADPFRKVAAASSAAPVSGGTSGPAPGGSAARPAEPSHIERLRALQDLGQPTSSAAARNYQVVRTHDTNPEMEERIAKCENVSGSFLRSVREYKKVSSEEIMNVLKISKNYLTALEQDDVARLPANVFVRGFVIQYAKALKLDHDKITNAYMAFLKAKRPG